MIKIQLFLLVISCVLSSSNGFRDKRGGMRCRYEGQHYTPGQAWSFIARNKNFTCTCSSIGVPECSWRTIVTSTPERCYDRRRGIHRREGDTWERRRRSRTYDCTCERNERRRMQISCSGANRCHRNGTSYKTDDEWQLRAVEGMMNCKCHGQERVTCRVLATTELPTPAVDAQWVESHIVLGRQVLRPLITTLQACDTGHRVVSSGYTWNQTGEVRQHDYTVQRCRCRDALIHCEPYQVSRRSESHCLSANGEMKSVGEKWIRVHSDHSNIRWSCHCRGHADAVCQDIGYCPDPTPPHNGGMVCVKAGDDGHQQSVYCKPMCSSGYDFFNRRRYYRKWEVCSQVTHHRWSGGFAGDGLLLGKCRVPRTSTRGRSSLYLPTNDCESLTAEQINYIKRQFVISLRANHLCDNKCEVKWFKCGRKQ